MKAVALQGTRMLDFRLPCAVCYDVQPARSGHSSAQANCMVTTRLSGRRQPSSSSVRANFSTARLPVSMFKSVGITI
jgi:hypothetical protein